LERTPDQEAANEALVKLVRQCMAGDSQSWQQLVVSQHRRIYAICYRFTGSGNDAEDLTQEVFLKLYKNLASFDTHKGSFQTWTTTLRLKIPVEHSCPTRLDRAPGSLDATFDGEEGGPTMADRLADPGPPRSNVAGLETQGPRPERPQTALPRAPRSSYSSRSRRYGLQRDIPGSPESPKER
jgi:RNA polymerase sigma-70 factor (ECF subfamily)